MNWAVTIEVACLKLAQNEKIIENFHTLLDRVSIIKVHLSIVSWNKILKVV